jgi:hypothetical protein
MTTLIANHISATHQGCAARGEAEEPKRESLRLSAQLDALEWILMSHGEDGTRPNELSSTRSPTGVTPSFSASYFDDQAPDAAPEHRRVPPVYRPDRQAGCSSARAFPII